MIELSPSAAQEIQRIKQSRQQSDSYVQIEVKRGGCSGLIYQLTLIETLSQSNISELEERCSSQGVEILVKSSTKDLISGLKIDFSEDLMGGGFRFYNPHAVSSCGCGQSFSV